MRQRIAYIIPLSALFACCMQSCTQDEPAGGILSGGKSLHVSSATMNGGSHTETDAVTRLAGDDVPVPVTQGSLGIFRSQSTGYADKQSNKKYTYAGTGWQPATPGDVILLNADNAAVCAYYPYHDNIAYSDETALPLTSGLYTGGNGTHDPADLCYDTNRTLNAARRTANFTMRHALALLEFKLTREAGFTGDSHVTAVSVQNPGLTGTSTINITNGTYATATPTGTVDCNIGTDAGLLTGSSTVTVGILLVPFTSAAGLSVTFTVDGAPRKVDIAPGSIAGVQAGHRYTVKVHLEKVLAQVTGVDILPWTETEVTGTPVPSAGINVPKADIDLKDTRKPANQQCPLNDRITLSNLIWAEGNLQTDNDALLYQWATPTGYGYYYPWNSTYVKTENLWPNLTDPCSKLDPNKYGSGWRTPSRNELECLSRCTEGRLVTRNGVKGMWFMNKTKGLFLPAAGDQGFPFISGTSGPQYSAGSDTEPNEHAGEAGSYWASDGSTSGTAQQGNPSGMSGAKLGFSDNGASVTSNVYASYGFSVRCVRNKPN